MKNVLKMMVCAIVIVWIMQPMMAVAAEWPKHTPKPRKMLSRTRKEIRGIIREYALKPIPLVDIDDSWWAFRFQGSMPSTVKNMPKDRLWIFKSEDGVEIDINFDKSGVVDEVVYVFSWPPTSPYLTLTDIPTLIPGTGKNPVDELDGTIYADPNGKIKWKARMELFISGRISEYIEMLGFTYHDLRL